MRPRRPFLTAEWRHLVMLNYEIDPEILAPLVPVGTTLDLWRGRALVSVVGFRFLGTRLFGVPIPGHRDFDEVNLRFYVRRETPGGETRHGVVFVRELVSRLAVALGARLAYNEPYRTLRMRSVTPRRGSEAPGRLAYEWRIGGVWEGLAATALGAPAVPEEGAEATVHHAASLGLHAPARRQHCGVRSRAPAVADVGGRGRDADDGRGASRRRGVRDIAGARAGLGARGRRLRRDRVPAAAPRQLADLGSRRRGVLSSQREGPQ